MKVTNDERMMVLIAIVLYISSAIVAGLFTLWIRGFNSDLSSSEGIGNIIYVCFRYMIVMAIVSEVYKGKKWARIAMVVFSSLTVISALFNIVYIFSMSLIGIITVLILLLNISCIVLMIKSKAIIRYFDKINGQSLEADDNYIA